MRRFLAFFDSFRPSLAGQNEHHFEVGRLRIEGEGLRTPDFEAFFGKEGRIAGKRDRVDKFTCVRTKKKYMFAKRLGKGDWYVHGVLNEGAKVNKLIIKTQYLPSNLLLRSF